MHCGKKHGYGENEKQLTSEVRFFNHFVLSGKKFITKKIQDELERTPLSRKDPIRKLTARQREVLQLLAEGHSAKRVGDILNISPRTVEFHKYKIMEELGIYNSADLVHYAIKVGIVSV